MSGSGYLYGALALVGVVLVAPSLKTVEPAGQPPPAPEAETASGERRVGNGLGKVELARAPDSHFYAEAQVNGARIRFMVDTGASSVVLTHADAQRAGLGAGNYSAIGKGAGGTVRLMPVTLARVGLGSLTAEQVPAMVAEEGSLEISLLGQSYLSRLGSVAIEDDRMILR